MRASLLRAGSSGERASERNCASGGVPRRPCSLLAPAAEDHPSPSDYVRAGGFPDGPIACLLPLQKITVSSREPRGALQSPSFVCDTLPFAVRIMSPHVVPTLGALDMMIWILQVADTVADASFLLVLAVSTLKLDLVEDVVRPDTNIQKHAPKPSSTRRREWLWLQLGLGLGLGLGLRHR